ncbi:tubulin polymerization-promoting protein family member 2 isoform X2 [Hippopotamus amphibius kiboko]|uniref:tubulin polymerization-promoting protein family member 2 isoform X2 n=1 Tax=Hippopotamus amphibius kiboko TaxID=575201 RepID=UPI002596BC35|nr:tubulin polymerization-promoting protein family member 2 isoform X2 [Hippopotamus amphibius kiboko]
MLKAACKSSLPLLPHSRVSRPTVLPHLQLTMASEAERTFQRFAVFGESSSSGTEMNNKNFSKMCKDCGIMDGKTVTSTDVDIVFSKVKAKNARTITFQQFQEAMKELGQKRFKGKSPDEALENIYRLMEGKDPATTSATKATTVGGVSRLTDTSKYTGTHKERFDESGKGKGIAGREDVTHNSGYARPSPRHHTLSNSRRTLHLTGQKTFMTWLPPCLQPPLYRCLLPPVVRTPPPAHVVSSTQNAALSSGSHPHRFHGASSCRHQLGGPVYGASAWSTTPGTCAQSSE